MKHDAQEPKGYNGGTLARVKDGGKLPLGSDTGLLTPNDSMCTAISVPSPDAVRDCGEGTGWMVCSTAVSRCLKIAANVNICQYS